MQIYRRVYYRENDISKPERTFRVCATDTDAASFSNIFNGGGGGRGNCESSLDNFVLDMMKDKKKIIII